MTGIKHGLWQYQATFRIVLNIINKHFSWKKVFNSLTLFYTRGLGKVVLYVMVPQPCRFSLRYFTKVWQFNHTKVIFQMGEGYAAIHRGGGLPVVGLGKSDDSLCWLCNHLKYSIQIGDGF